MDKYQSLIVERKWSWQIDSLEIIPAATELLALRIAGLRSANTDVVITEASSTNPVPVSEAEIQALRYLRGFLHIVEFTPDEDQQTHLFNHMCQVLVAFKKKVINNHSANTTFWLADQLAGILKSGFAIADKKARKQITMARDLCILLEEHLPVKTTSQYADGVTVEESTPFKVPDNNRIRNYQHEQWFHLAKQAAGFVGENSCWLDQFFQCHAEKIVTNGVSAPPSARWLPTPANMHRVEIITSVRTSLIRMGILPPFDIDDVVTQREIAKQTIVDIIKQEIADKVKAYRKLYEYEDNTPITFAFSYQTLLSPFAGEGKLPHKENSVHFINLIKEVLQELQPNLKNIIPNTHVYLFHTNTPINKYADLAIDDPRDMSIRIHKIELTKATMVQLIISRLEKNNPDLEKNKKRYDLLNLSHLQLLQMIKDLFPLISPELLNEIELRACACTHLSLAMKASAPYDKLATHQRNLMIAALELLALGSQSLTLSGCKSARDRTSILLAAIKVMQENHAAMHDWPTLFSGIITNIKQGHQFRAMHFHNAVVKVDCVHEDYMQALSSQAQTSIKTFKPFSNKLQPYSSVYPDRLRQFLSIFTNDAEPTLGSEIELREMPRHQ